MTDLLLPHQPALKRPRKLPEWESCFAKEEKHGLSDLFGRTTVNNLDNHQARTFLHDNFFTLRLEHREGGTMARHPGEERFLLFRSDRAGAIAKIIFSSTRNENAKIHVLDVKADYRGKDLGGFLFSEAVNALTRRYQESVDCQLDAEEDVQRHDRLLSFYEQLGCEVKPKARIRYIHNNDGETYRKIPMRIHLEESRTHPRSSMLHGLHFLPIQLLEATGDRAAVAGCSQSRRLDWLLVEHGSDRIQFRTTLGHLLCTDKHGRCYVTEEEDEEGYFHLYRVPTEGSDRNDSESENIRRKELWILKSTQGTFLTVDEKTLGCSSAPYFWQADNAALSLTCTFDTPPRRQHYRKFWAKQTLAYVQDMQSRYLGFNLARMTLRQALHLMRDVPSQPFSVHNHGPSIRTLCFRTAEEARKNGQPDWVKLIALVHELGCVANLVDANTAIESEDDYDWTLASRSRIVGCASPDRVSFSEFRYLNSDEYEYKTKPEGMYNLHCGFENITMAWTGPEYVHHMLKHNGSLIPDEGLAMLRYFTLGDWHTHHEYAHLTNEDDEDVKAFVAEFDSLRRTARKNCVEEMPVEECDRLWDEHYSDIAAKYGLDGVLQW